MTFTPKELVIDGTERKQGNYFGYLVRIDPHEVYLPHAQFIVLWKLCDPVRWYPSGSLVTPSRLTGSYLWRLRAYIQEETGTDWQVYENDRHGHYRLYTAPACRIKINPKLRVTEEGRIAA